MAKSNSTAKTDFLGYGAAEDAPGFQAGWSDYMCVFSFFVASFAHLEIPSKYFVLIRAHCRIGTQPRCLVGRRPVSLLIGSVF
jgi:hypothetical protein